MRYISSITQYLDIICGRDSLISDHKNKNYTEVPDDYDTVIERYRSFTQEKDDKGAEKNSIPSSFAEFIETILWNENIINHPSPITNQFTAEAIGRKLVSVYDRCLHCDI